MTREKYKQDVVSRLRERGIEIEAEKLQLKRISLPKDEQSRYRVWYGDNELGEIFKRFVILVHRGRIGQWHFTTKRSHPEEGLRGGRAGGPFERRTDALEAFLVIALSELLRKQHLNQSRERDSLEQDGSSPMIILDDPPPPLLPRRLRKQPKQRIDPFQP